jgi:3-hydroxyacyl-CoA dehydrogenase
MSVTALIPFKPKNPKTRLSCVLDEQEREAFAHAMLLDVVDAVRDADYVQESVPDNYDFKKQVFREMDIAAPSHAILASSSSGLLMTEIQKVTTRPRRCVLVHPVLPVYLIPLVEIAGGRQTSRETLMVAHDL